MFYLDVRDREVLFPLRKAGVKNLRVNSDSSKPEVMMGIKHVFASQRRSSALTDNTGGV